MIANIKDLILSHPKLNKIVVGFLAPDKAATFDSRNDSHIDAVPVPFDQLSSCAPPAAYRRCAAQCAEKRTLFVHQHAAVLLSGPICAR